MKEDEREQKIREIERARKREGMKYPFGEEELTNLNGLRSFVSFFSKRADGECKREKEREEESEGERKRERKKVREREIVRKKK